MDGKCYKITQTILNSENSSIPSNYITCQDVFHGNKTKSDKQQIDEKKQRNLHTIRLS